MYKKIVSIFIVFLMILMPLSACSASQNNKIYDSYMDDISKQKKDLNNHISADKDGENTLVITGYDKLSKYIDTNASKFMESHPDVDIINDSNEDISNYTDNFSVRIMTENLGDIVFLPGNISYKNINDAYFLDLSSFVENDKDINDENYFMNILTGGANEDGLFFLTSGVGIMDYCLMRNDISDDLTERFETKVDLTYDDLLDIYFEYNEKLDDDEKWIFLEFYDPFSYIRYKADSLIDYENKKANFYDVDFMANMEKVKKDLLTSFDIKYTADGPVGTIYSSTDFLGDLTDKNGDYMFYSNLGGIKHYYLDLKEKCFSKPRLLQTAGGKYSYAPHGIIAINKNTSNPELAWEFVKCLIGEKEELQYLRDSNMESNMKLIKILENMLTFFPINKKNFELVADIELKNNWEIALRYSSRNKDGRYDITGTFEDYKKSYLDGIYEIISEYNYCKLNDDEVFGVNSGSIVYHDMYLYVTDQQSIEQTMLNIQNKIEIWLNE